MLVFFSDQQKKRHSVYEPLFRLASGNSVFGDGEPRQGIEQKESIMSIYLREISFPEEQTISGIFLNDIDGYKRLNLATYYPSGFAVDFVYRTLT
jgi:hypothetical protein